MLTFPARLSVEDGPVRRGRLRLSSAEITWRSGLRSPTNLTGAAVLTAAMQQVRHRRGDVEVQLRLADGRVARLVLPEAEAAATVRMLSGRDIPGVDPTRIRPSGRTWWAITSLTVAGLWVALMVAAGLDGYTATATVVRSAGTWTCAVTWQSPSGTPEHDDTDCFDEPPGSSLEILVPYGDYEGAVTTRPMLALVGVIGAVPLATIGAARLRVVSRHRRTNAALIRLAAGDLDPGAAAGPPASAAAAAVTTRALARAHRLSWSLLALGVVGIVATIGLATVMDRADRELRATGVTTVGTVVEVHPDSKLTPGGADVRFTASTVTASRYVRLGSDADWYVEGQDVDVLYDRAEPDRFTIDDVPYEPPWTTWPFLAAIALGLFATPVGIWRVRNAHRTSRVLAAGRWAPVRVRIRPEDKFYFFTTEDGSVWRSSTGLSWPSPDPEGVEVLPSDDGSPEDGSPEDWPVEDAWWVRDGEFAVFSPDRGRPLALSRLR